MADPLLAIDVGNSRIKFGLFDAAACRPDSTTLPACLASVASPVADEAPWDEIRAWRLSGRVRGRSKSIETAMRGIVAGANPQGIARVVDTWPADWPAPRVINDPALVPIATRLVHPRRVGIDRVLNAVAANVARPAGRPVIIVDSGTATTVDLVGADGVFEGGAILPGFELSARSLHHYTALLPLIPIDELGSEPPDALGRETRAALRSGLYWGQVGAVKELVGRLGTDGGSPRGAAKPRRAAPSSDSSPEPLVLLTGGGGALLAPHFPAARVERHLALQGLAMSDITASP